MNMKNKILIVLTLIVSIVFFGFEREKIMGIPTKYFGKPKTVVATVYKPYKKHNTTADGTKFGSKVNDTLKIIAVSRDLKKEYPFGSKVLVIGAGELDGIYTVRDFMGFNKKGKPQRNMIDILVDKKHRNVKFKGVQIMKISDEYFVANM